MNKTIFYKILYGFACAITLLFVARTNTITHPDSLGYINADLIRSFGYPMFLAIHKIIFGSQYLAVVSFSQCLFILISAYIFTKTIEKHLIYNKLYVFLLFVILLVPIFFETKVANSILSEGISYSLYLLFLSCFFEIVFTPNPKVKYFVISVLLVFLLINTRGQFLFLIPFLILILALKHYHKKIDTKKFYLLFVLIIVIPIISILTDKTYHKIKHNHFVSTPWTGIQLAALPFFLSQEEDATLFKNDTEKKYFLFVYKKIKKQKLLLSQLNPDEYDYDFYAKNYTTICNTTLSEYGELFFKNDNALVRTVKNDKITIKIALILLKQHPIKWGTFVVKNLYNGFYSISYFVTLIFLLFISFAYYLKTKAKLFFVVAFLSLLVFLNLVLIALVEPIIARYIFYNNWVFLVIITFLIENSTQKIKSCL